MKNYDTHRFLEKLGWYKIRYHYEGKWLVFNGDSDGYVGLSFKKFETLPDYIKFNNEGHVGLADSKLSILPNHIEFNNGGNVYLYDNQLTSLPDDIQFNNGGFVNLSNNPLKSLPDNIDEFYDRLSIDSKRYIQKTFPDHWVVNKERFNL